MTVFLDGRKVEIIAADLDASRVTVTYHDDEFDDETTHLDYKRPLEDRHRDPIEAYLLQLNADDGADEVYDTIADLPDEHIDGDAVWLDDRRTDDAE